VPDRGLLADLCREAAARESVQPYLVEKDYYLTRLLWALGSRFGDKLLLKGGTLLSKVDLGFFRMSEDADFVIPEAASANRGANMRRINILRDALTELEPLIGVKRRFPSGEDSEKGAHRVWALEYPSEFGANSIQLEVSLRHCVRKPRRVRLSQLIEDPMLGDLSVAYCWAMNADEARAEKVRAAFTREAIRDFYDLDRIADTKADLTSTGFISLVDIKLQELGAPKFKDQVPPFGLTQRRRRALDAGLKQELAVVLRANAPAFDLDRMLLRFGRLWDKAARRGGRHPR
jgi:predicted nucleotidyltransferase component of viral defense system